MMMKLAAVVGRDELLEFFQGLVAEICRGREGG
jgi:hypothetical protein